MKTGQKTGLWWRVLAFAGALVLAFSGGNVASAAPLLGEVTTPEAWINLTSGDDATGDGSQEKPFKTVSKAQQVLGAGGGTLHVSGTQEGITEPVVVNNKFVLDVTADTVFSGTLPQTNTTGAVLQISSGASVQTAQGASLTVTNTGGNKNALTVNNTAKVGDGTYVINGTFSESGTVAGSSRDSLNISVQGKFAPAAGVSLSHATIAVTDPYKSGLDFSPNATDIAFSSDGMNVSMAGKSVITNSDITISNSAISVNGGKAAINSYGNVTLQGSNLTVSGGRISIQYGASWAVNNSTVRVKNSSSGALHVNQTINSNATVVFNDSQFTTENVSFEGPTMGVGNPLRPNANGSELTFKGNSVVNTAAAGNDAIGQNGGGKLVVLGGSYRVNPAKTTTTSANPTNGPDHGNETLTYFRLANPGDINSINIRDINGTDYTYPVANASSDGNKYVWAPAVTVTYELNNESASFAGGSNLNYAQKVIRGQSASLTNAVSGTAAAFPAAPTDSAGRTFAGWVVKETGEPFTSATSVSADTTVQATWEGEVGARVLYYPNTSDTDAPISVSATDEPVTAATLEEMQGYSQKFVRDHYDFKGWSTTATGDPTVQPGDEVTLQDDKLRLYAVWSPKTYSVAFSANGGTFNADSPFKSSLSDKFDIVQDKVNGGEKAVYKEKVPYGTTYQDLGLESNYFGLIAGGSEDTATPWAKKKFFKPYHTEFRCDAGPHPASPSNCYGPYVAESWFTSPDGEGEDGAVKMSETIAGDTTIYLRWTPNTQTEYNEDYSIPVPVAIKADTVNLGENKLLVGDTATASLSFEVAGLRDKVKAGFADYTSAGVSLQDVQIHYPALRFNVSLTAPDTLTVPAQVSAENVKLTDGSGFTVESVSSAGNTVTVALVAPQSAQNAQQLLDNLAESPKVALSVSGFSVVGPAATDQKLQASVQGKFSTVSEAVQSPDSARAGGSSGLAFVSPLAFLSFLYSVPTETTVAEGRVINVTWNGVDITDATVEPFTTFSVVEPAVMGADGLALNANILLNHSGKSEDSKVVVVQPGDAVEWIGQLDVKSIQDKIQQMSNLYCGTDQDECAQMLGNTVSDFVVTLALPKGLLAPADLTADQLGFNSKGLFKVASVSVENPALSSGGTAAPGAVDNGGQIVRIKLSLAKEGSASTQNYNTFKELLDDVLAENPTLEAHVPTTVATDVTTGVNLTGTGTVTGNFSAVAIKDGQVQKWNFGWNGVQDAAAGKPDEAAPNAIAATVGALPSATQLDLPADLVIATAGKDDQSTQNTAVRYVKRGAQYDYTGVLDVKSIKQKIAALGSALASCDANTQDCADAYSSISLQDVASGFTGVLTLPAGVTPPASVEPAAVRFPENDLFEVSSVTVEGQKVTMVTTLKKNYDNFNSLYEDVQSVPDTLTLTLPNALVASDLTSENQLKATGEISGDFQGVAHRNDNWMYFSFAWMGKQISGKGDSTCDSDACKNDITLTVAPKLRDIAVTKNWVGVDAASAPAVEVNITAPDESEPKQNLAERKLTLNSAGEWTGKFEKLDWYEADGVTEIAYTPAELALNGYSSESAGDMEDGFTITNTRNMQTLSVTKQWEGVPSSDTTPLPEVTVYLVENGEKTDKSVVLNAENGYTSSFEVPVATVDGTNINYSVSENAVAGYTGAVTGNATDGFTITNTLNTVDVKVKKKWEGVAAEDAPAVTVTLLADGKALEGEAITLSQENEWTGTFTGLPATKADGVTAIQYTVAEEPVAGYEGSVSVTEDGVLVLNKRLQRTVSVTKKWVGVAEGASTPEVTINLLADGEKIDSVKLNSANGYAGSFVAPLSTPRGNNIVYTVAEDAVAGFKSEVTGDAETGFTVTNTRITEPAPEPTPEPGVTPEPAPAPQPARPADKTLSVTGGSNAVPLLAGGMLLTGAAVCGLLAWRRRKQA